MPQVIDCFLFRDELAMLSLRLKYLHDCVDHFVVVSGSHSFQGEALPDALSPLPATLEAYRGKLQRHVAQLLHTGELDSWGLEERQRNASIEAIAALDPDDEDLIILSDVDEIYFDSVPSLLLNAFAEKRFPADEKVLLPMWDSYFAADVVQETPWRRVFAMPWRRFRAGNPFKERTDPGIEIIGGNVGWHITYAGGLAAIQRKQHTFAHTEFAGTKYLNPDWLQNCIDTLQDPYERAIDWKRLSWDKLTSLMEPRLLQLLQHEYPQFLSAETHAAVKQRLSSNE